MEKEKDELFHISPVVEAWHYSSPLISINKFKEQCLSKISGEDLNPIKNVSTEEEENEEFAKKLGVDQETIADLIDVCDISNLECDYDRKFDYNKLQVYEDYPEDDNKLQVIKMCKLGKTTMESNVYVPTFFEPPDEDFTTDNELVSENEVIVNCQVLHSQRLKKKVVQALVLADTKLSELRDLIQCRSDKAVFEECSNNPDAVIQEAKSLFSSSFLFIEKTFYNDTRNPLNRDYSKIIMDWAKSSDNYDVPGLGLLNSKSMEDTTFGDLEIRLGYPYLFCHQGNCEHLVIFTDMRIRNENDPKLRTSYPFKISEDGTNVRKCSICHIHRAKWVTLNDTLAFEDPALYCDKCYRYLHYTADGKKITSFEAYPYTG